MSKENQKHLVLKDSLKFFNFMRNILHENQEFIYGMTKEEFNKRSKTENNTGFHNDLDREIDLYVNQSESNLYLKAFQIGNQIKDRTKTTIVCPKMSRTFVVLNMLTQGPWFCANICSQKCFNTCVPLFPSYLN